MKTARRSMIGSGMPISQSSAPLPKPIASPPGGCVAWITRRSSSGSSAALVPWHALVATKRLIEKSTSMVQNRFWRGPNRYAEDSEVACMDRDGRAQTEGLGKEKGQCSKDRTSVKAIVGSYRVQGAHARYTVGCAGMKGTPLPLSVRLVTLCSLWNTNQRKRGSLREGVAQFSTTRDPCGHLRRIH